jgi:hypothetical protein
MGQPARKAFIVDLRFAGRSASWEALRRVESQGGLTILRGRVTRKGARLEVVPSGAAARRTGS